MRMIKIRVRDKRVAVMDWVLDRQSRDENKRVDERYPLVKNK